MVNPEIIEVHHSLKFKATNKYISFRPKESFQQEIHRAKKYKINTKITTIFVSCLCNMVCFELADSCHINYNFIKKFYFCSEITEILFKILTKKHKHLTYKRKQWKQHRFIVPGQGCTDFLMRGLIDDFLTTLLFRKLINA